LSLATFKGPHILILDEPTNHLDVDARQALVQALNEFAGAVILISHDRHLIATCADRLWIAEEGTVKPYDGDIDAYAERVLETARGRRRSARKPAQRVERMSSQVDSSPPAARRSNLVPLHKTIQEAEANISTLQEKIAVLDRALADPLLHRDEPRRANDFARLRSRLSEDLESAETRWLAAQAELESRAQGG
jgi:ATP-binding cassette subfamily F protein 3